MRTKTLLLGLLVLMTLPALATPAAAEGSTEASLYIRCPVIIDTVAVASQSSAAWSCTIVSGCTTRFAAAEASATSWYVNYVYYTPVSPSNEVYGASVYTSTTASNTWTYAACVL